MNIFRNLTIKKKLLFLIFLVNIIGTSGFTLYFYSVQKKDIESGIKSELLAKAYGVSHIVTPEYHADIKDKTSVSREKYLDKINVLTKYAKETKSKYLYTCMMFNDQIVFTSTSATQEELEKDSYSKFLEEYKSAPDSLRLSLIDGKLRYDQYTDQWGTFYSIFVPVRSSTGKLFAAGVDISASFVAETLWNTALRSVLFGLLIFIISFICMYFCVSRTMNPLIELTDYTRDLMDHDFNWSEYVRDKIKGIFETKGDEVGKLAEALSQMETMLQNYLKNLTETTAAKERIESELSIAHKIQMGILPRDIPAFPDHDDFDLYVIMEPAKEVGGDLYDYFMLDENRLFFLIGDVSDKGVPAALFMAVTKTLFKSNALSGNASVNEIMGKVNQDLSHGNPWQMFVTVFAGVLDLSTGEIIYSDGGHEPPIILRANKDPEIIKKKGGPALCFFEDYSYECGSIQLNPGDSIVLYTDGVTEAMNKERTLFGAERIKKALTGYQAVTPLEILTRGLFQNVKIFAGGEPQSDDIAILTIQYLGPDFKKKSELDHKESAMSG